MFHIPAKCTVAVAAGDNVANFVDWCSVQQNFAVNFNLNISNQIENQPYKNGNLQIILQMYLHHKQEDQLFLCIVISELLKTKVCIIIISAAIKLLVAISKGQPMQNYYLLSNALGVAANTSVRFFLGTACSSSSVTEWCGHFFHLLVLLLAVGLLFGLGFIDLLNLWLLLFLVCQSKTIEWLQLWFCNMEVSSPRSWQHKSEKCVHNVSLSAVPCQEQMGAAHCG